MKEKALIDESQHVRKFEDLFQNVRSVTGHEDLERVVNEFTAKDEENFARFDSNIVYKFVNYPAR